MQILAICMVALSWGCGKSVADKNVRVPSSTPPPFNISIPNVVNGGAAGGYVAGGGSSSSYRLNGAGGNYAAGTATSVNYKIKGAVIVK